MGIYKQKPDGHGSLKDIQILINKKPKILNSAIEKQLGLQNLNIEWISPIDKYEYAEYSDKDFLKKLGIDEKVINSLASFWPRNGPQWDGLGKTDKGEIFLIEAKANIPEILSPPCGASPKSLEQIEKSLKEVKNYVGSTSKAKWSFYFYQYCNRLAYLYFLRVSKKLPAFLIFIYFVGDSSVQGPDTKEEWLGALKLMKQYLGVDKNHKLSKYILDIFFDVRNIKKEI